MTFKLVRKRLVALSSKGDSMGKAAWECADTTALWGQ